MLRIGEFAQLARVSIKMLRHYDEIGLLVPAHVDPVTGYRSYTLDQVERVHRIVALRELGFSLGDVGRLIAGPGSAYREALGSLRDEVERRIANDRARIAAIDASLGVAASGATSTRPVIRSTRPQLVASMRVGDGGADLLFERLESEVARHGARASRPPLELYHDDGAVDVAIPVTRSIPAGDGMVVWELPGAAAAISVFHRGEYATLSATWEALTREMDGWGLRRAGLLQVLYHRFGADRVGYDLPRANLAAHPGEFVTELLVPVSTTSG
jgi:DNA-binding transcriptional MerR regulator